MLLEGAELLVQLRNLALELLDLVEASELEAGVDAVDAGFDVLLDLFADLLAKLFGALDRGNLAEFLLNLLDALFDPLLALRGSARFGSGAHHSTSRARR